MESLQRRIAKEVGKDAIEVGKDLAGVAEAILVKTPAYMFGGSLTKEARQVVDNVAGTNITNNDFLAILTSCATNIIGYSVLVAAATGNSDLALAAATYGSVEYIVRALVIPGIAGKFDSPSVPGLIASIPIEYAIDVIRRAKRKEKNE